VADGYVGILWVELHFPEASSLKGKRKYVKSAKAQLQHRFGASVAEVEAWAAGLADPPPGVFLKAIDIVARTAAVSGGRAKS